MKEIDENFYINKAPYQGVFDFSYGKCPLSDEAVATYVALRSIQGSNQKRRMFVTTREICFELYGNTNNTRTDLEKIQSGLKQLDEVGYISIEESNGTSWYVLDVFNLYEDDTNIDYHCLLYRHEVWAIFSNPVITERFSFLRYFLCLIGSINTNASIRSQSSKDVKKNFVGMMQIQYLAQLARISDKTALKYNAVLEALELVYFERSKVYRVSKSGEQKTQPAHYGRWKDRDDIIEYARLENAKNKDTAEFVTISGLANVQRRLTMKYHALENGTYYSDDEMVEMYAIYEALWRFFDELADEAEKESTKKKLQEKNRELPLLDEWRKLNLKDGSQYIDIFKKYARSYYNQFLKERPNYEKNLHRNPKKTKRQEDALSNKTEMGEGKTEIKDRTLEVETRQQPRAKNGRKLLDLEV